MTTTIALPADPTSDAKRQRPFRSIDTVRFLLDPSFRADPYPLYARLRNQERVHHAAMAVTLVSGYEECLAVLKDPNASSNEGHVDLRFRAGRQGGRFAGRSTRPADPELG